MNRFILSPLAVVLLASAADAGPLRNLACRVAHRAQARPHVRQAACDVRQVAHAVASVPARVSHAHPVRTAVVDFALGVARVCGPSGCK